jgi:hypothetical protein
MPSLRSHALGGRFPWSTLGTTSSPVDGGRARVGAPGMQAAAVVGACGGDAHRRIHPIGHGGWFVGGGVPAG